MVVKVDVQKQRFGMYWTNRYLLNVASPADVSEAMAWAFGEYESQFHGTSVQFVSIRVSDMVENTDNFYIYPVSYAGVISDGGAALPGYVTTRVDLGVGAGRPLRKYYRTYVGEDKIVGSVWESAYRTLVQTNIAALLALVPTWCDPQGNEATSIAVKLPIQMRQLRRGTKKPLTPVIPLE